MTAVVVPLLTVQQQRILNTIREYATEHGYAPSLREIGATVELTVSAVAFQVQQLEVKGWIRQHPYRPRAIVVLDPATGGA